MYLILLTLRDPETAKLALTADLVTMVGWTISISSKISCLSSSVRELMVSITLEMLGWSVDLRSDQSSKIALPYLARVLDTDSPSPSIPRANRNLKYGIPFVDSIALSSL